MACRVRRPARRDRRSGCGAFRGGAVTYLVGKIALDVTAGAPNNGRGENNVGEVKQLRIGRDPYPYVSAQAFRRWLRDSLPAGEPRSPVTRTGRVAGPTVTLTTTCSATWSRSRARTTSATPCWRPARSCPSRHGRP